MKKYSFLFLLLFFGTALSTAEAQEGGVYHSLEEAIKADLDGWFKMSICFIDRTLG